MQYVEVIVNMRNLRPGEAALPNQKVRLFGEQPFIRSGIKFQELSAQFSSLLTS